MATGRQSGGSIHRRASDGRWVGVLVFEDDLGRQRRKAVYSKTGVVDERTLLGSILDDWLAMARPS